MMVEKSGRPAYLQIVDELRGQIRAGELPPGAALPSIAQLCERFGVSASVVKAAISVLRTEGVVIGQQGKGVFVHQVPADGPTGVAEELAALRQELAEVRRRLAALEAAVRPEK
ncbi:winged helix-turn-helix domain-containing protein [Streptosporangium sp. NPDC006930]|uniref:winged helix-turn-helix domain-containing protein n=1 Tax=Streptosporangium sp. NPDC006930 TaxID=3154783 RepID=UPI003417A6F7